MSQKVLIKKCKRWFVVADLKGELGLDILVKEAKSQDGERGVAKVVH